MVESLFNHKKYHSVQIEISHNRWAHYKKLAPRLKMYLIYIMRGGDAPKAFTKKNLSVLNKFNEFLYM